MENFIDLAFLVGCIVALVGVMNFLARREKLPAWPPEHDGMSDNL